MAYVPKEKKAKIAAAVKAVMPKDWKYSLAVRNHSTIACTIYSAPIDLLSGEREYSQINVYHADQHYEGKTLETIHAILKALNTDNFDDSDSMTDYFHVGHYVDLNIGKWDKPFICTAERKAA